MLANAVFSTFEMLMPPSRENQAWREKDTYPMNWSVGDKQRCQTAENLAKMQKRRHFEGPGEISNFGEILKESEL